MTHRRIRPELAKYAREKTGRKIRKVQVLKSISDRAGGARRGRETPRRATSAAQQSAKNSDGQQWRDEMIDEEHQRHERTAANGLVRPHHHPEVEHHQR